MVDLDDLLIYQRLDTSGMLDHLRQFPGQCRSAWEKVLKFDLPPQYSPIDKVVILGMGGSAIGGDMVRRLTLAESKVPVWVHRDYSLPPFVDQNTLVIASSYSGNTEETLSAFTASLKIPAKKLVFTDLDGTLLHPVTYSYTQAVEALRRLQEREIPIIFCSAKTKAEQEVYRAELGIRDPFIVESGGAIFIPKDYFHLHFNYDKATKDYLVIELGTPHQEVRRKVKKIVEEETGCRFIGFDDMSVEEVARETGLSLVSAEFAKQREYSATIKIEGDKKGVNLALKKIKQAGFSCTFGGRFYEVTAGSDKGRAVKVLAELFKLNLGKIMTVGIGDNESDVPMLAVVDLPILVQSHRRRWTKLKLRNIHKIKGVGPEGWSMAIRELVTD